MQTSYHPNTHARARTADARRNHLASVHETPSDLPRTPNLGAHSTREAHTHTWGLVDVDSAGHPQDLKALGVAAPRSPSSAAEAPERRGGGHSCNRADNEATSAQRRRGAEESTRDRATKHAQSFHERAWSKAHRPQSPACATSTSMLSAHNARFSLSATLVAIPEKCTWATGSASASNRSKNHAASK